MTTALETRDCGKKIGGCGPRMNKHTRSANAVNLFPEVKNTAAMLCSSSPWGKTALTRPWLWEEDRLTGTSGGQTFTVHMCCPLLKRIQLTFTLRFRVPWHSRRLSGVKKIETPSKTWISAITWRAFLNKYRSSFIMCSVYDKPEVKFTHNSNHTERYRERSIISHAQNTDCTSAQCNLTGTHRSLVTKDGRLSAAQTTAKVNCRLHSQ